MIKSKTYSLKKHLYKEKIINYHKNYQIYKINKTKVKIMHKKQVYKFKIFKNNYQIKKMKFKISIKLSNKSNHNQKQKRKMKKI